MADIKFKDVTPEQFAINLRQLKNEGKIGELVDMIYDAHTDYYSSMKDEGVNARLSETEKFIEELSSVKEGKEINPDNVAFLNQIMQAFSEKHYNAAFDAGKRRDSYENEIKNGNVRGTELLKDEPKTVRKIAHDLVMRDDGVASDAFVHFYRTLNNSLQGKTINGKDAQDINVEISKKVLKSIGEKEGISPEKADIYMNEYENRDYHSSLGFKYKKGKLAPGESPFEEIPKYLKDVQSCKSAEELEALEDSLNSLLDQHDHYEKQIKSTVKVANHLLKEFDSIDWPEKDTISYKDIRHCLEHYTHLGKDYRYESPDIMSERNRKEEAERHKPVKNIFPAYTRNAAELIDRGLRDMFDQAADKCEDLKEKGMIDSPEYKAAKKMVEITQYIYQMKDTAEKITEAYAKANDSGNLEKIENAELTLKYIEKSKKMNKLTILPKVGDDAYIRSIDDTLSKLSDSLADCYVKPDESRGCYEKLTASLLEHKRLYKKIRAAESLSDDKLKEKYTKQLATNASAIKKAIKNCKSYEKSTEKTEGLISGESNRIGTLDELSDNLESTVSILKKSAAEVSFDKYIRLHSGKYSGKTVGEKKKNIAKVIAAYSLKKEGKKISVKDIHKAANEIEEFYCIKTNPDYDTRNGGKQRLMDATKDEKSMIREAVKLRVGLYGIKNGKYDEFVRDMNTLKDSMRTSKGRSSEYTALCKAIKEVGELNEKTAGMTEEQKADAFANANIKVVMAVQKYVKGKETVRIQDKGNDAFANSMDALSIISKYTRREGQAMNESVIKVVNKINEVRKDNLLSDANRFAKGYGAERAKMAHDRRMAAEKSKPKAKEIVK